MAKKAVILKAASKKKYLPNSKEKYMCAKHKKFFTDAFVAVEKRYIKIKQC